MMTPRRHYVSNKSPTDRNGRRRSAVRRRRPRVGMAPTRRLGRRRRRRVSRRRV